MDAQLRFGSHRLSADECTSAQLAIDAEIEETSSSSAPESGRMLHARRNTYALINAWFPAEIMVAIFYEIITTSRHTGILSRGGYSGFNFSRTWIIITHVCQNWRRLAIGAPRLWEGICFANAEITALMLQRTKASLVSVDYRSGYHLQPCSIGALLLALSHSDRAFEIILTIPPRKLQDMISRYLSKPMPSLKRLELSIGRSGTEDVQCFLPPGCLEGTNSLRHLVLLTIGISTKSILPTTLTQLVLYYLPEKFTVSQILGLLEPLENLRDLSIEMALRSDISDVGPPDRLSLRTSLRRLRFIAEPGECTDFMRRFPITPATQTTLHAAPKALHHFRFGQLLGPVYGATGLLRGLSISYATAFCIDTYVGASLPMVPSELCFSVSVRPQQATEGMWHEALHDFCAHVLLDRVETLAVKYISANDEDLAKVIAQLLASQVHGLRMLSASSTAMKHLLRVMHPQDNESGPAFPLLRTLQVDDPYCSVEGKKELAVSIAKCLIARRGLGKVAEVEELAFNTDEVPLECLEDLESLKSWEPPVHISTFWGLGPEVIERRRWSWSRQHKF